MRIQRIILFLVIVLTVSATIKLKQSFASSGQIYYNVPGVFQQDETMESSPSADSGVSFMSVTGTLHTVFGYTTLAAGITTVVLGITIPDNDIHETMGAVTAGLALSTCTTGIIAYHEYIDFSNGSIVYNSHFLLGLLATAACISSMLIEDGDSVHKGLGIGSGVSFMLTVAVIQF
ncbi:MAG: hypothetical protein GY754_30190 [bacterium]|nr:hypothetical protein [bacterium]